MLQIPSTRPWALHLIFQSATVGLLAMQGPGPVGSTLTVHLSRLMSEIFLDILVLASYSVKGLAGRLQTAGTLLFVQAVPLFDTLPRQQRAVGVCDAISALWLAGFLLCFLI